MLKQKDNPFGKFLSEKKKKKMERVGCIRPMDGLESLKRTVRTKSSDVGHGAVFVLSEATQQNITLHICPWPNVSKTKNLVAHPILDQREEE